MHKSFLITGAILGAMAVALGAFGAHGLQRMELGEPIIQGFRTGVQYQFFHALALIATAIIFSHYSNNKIKWAGICFISGIILFCGSLYLITLLNIFEMDTVRLIGPLTPLGGLFMIAGWVLLVVGILKTKEE